MSSSVYHRWMLKVFQSKWRLLLSGKQDGGQSPIGSFGIVTLIVSPRIRVLLPLLIPHGICLVSVLLFKHRYQICAFYFATLGCFFCYGVFVLGDGEGRKGQVYYGCLSEINFLKIQHADTASSLGIIYEL